MTQSRNQERGRKRLRGQSRAIPENQPSKALGQDQPTERSNASGPNRAVANERAGTIQGISNRPASEEHAFPESPEDAEAGRVDTSTPQQQGGNKGGV